MKNNKNQSFTILSSPQNEVFQQGDLGIGKISKGQEIALKDARINMRIPFLFMLKEKGQKHVRGVKDSEMIFGKNSYGNILMGRDFSHNMCGDNCQQNIFTDGDSVIEVDLHKLTWVDMLKISAHIFKSLKNTRNGTKRRSS